MSTQPNKRATPEQLAAQAVASYTSSTQAPSCILCKHCEEQPRLQAWSVDLWRCNKLGHPVTPKALCVFFERRGPRPEPLDNAFGLARERLGY